MVVPGGDLEMSLLTELWQQPGATVRQLHEVVGVPRGIVYTTVAKVLDRMVDKGLVRRHAVGRAYAYDAAVDRAGRPDLPPRRPRREPARPRRAGHRQDARQPAVQSPAEPRAWRLGDESARY